MKGSRAKALLSGLAAAAALVVTACGVPPSDVIEAGEPAGIVVGPSPTLSAAAAVSLYFLASGELRAYPRRIGDPSDLGAVVGQLFGGPSAGEAVTATTQLPRLTGTPVVAAGSGNGISVKLPKGVARLGQPALLQLACTLARAAESGTRDPLFTESSPAPVRTSVQVLGDGWSVAQPTDSCPAPADT